MSQMSSRLVKPIVIPAVSDVNSNSMDCKPAAVDTSTVESLPVISTCSACYDNDADDIPLHAVTNTVRIE